LIQILLISYSFRSFHQSTLDNSGLIPSSAKHRIHGHNGDREVLTISNMFGELFICSVIQRQKDPLSGRDRKVDMMDHLRGQRKGSEISLFWTKRELRISEGSSRNKRERGRCHRKFSEGPLESWEGCIFESNAWLARHILNKGWTSIWNLEIT
jgi:hypothetical protein